MDYAIVPIERWPEGWNRNRPPTKRSQFSATWNNTLSLLLTELSNLRASEVKIQVDLTRDDFRLDGNLRTTARIDYPGVILGFVTKKFGGLSYPCNTYGSSWKDNVRAIALGLEALRKVERYGIAERGQQYAGWAELPSGMSMPSMTRDRAHELLIQASGVEDDGEGDWDYDALFRNAAVTHHPDKGGDAEYFKLLVEARDLLEEA